MVVQLIRYQNDIGFEFNMRHLVEVCGIIFERKINRRCFSIGSATPSMSEIQEFIRNTSNGCILIQNTIENVLPKSKSNLTCLFLLRTIVLIQ